jgi:hypothetical protein
VAAVWFPRELTLDRSVEIGYPLPEIHKKKQQRPIVALQAA